MTIKTENETGNQIFGNFKLKDGIAEIGFFFLNFLFDKNGNFFRRRNILKDKKFMFAIEFSK